MLEFSVLGSGSGGNCAVARCGDDCVLVDAGLSAKQIVLRLEQVGVAADDVTGIVLTHEHGDHTRGIDVFMRNRDVPVYCNARTREVMTRYRDFRSEITWRLFESGDAFQIGAFRVESFDVTHDAVEPVGYVLRNGEGSVGVVSDLGKVTHLVRDRLDGVDTLYVEANYDEVMLQNDTKRPWSTKQRISNPHGHLSNDQAADLVVSIAQSNLHRVVLGHLSRDCNAPDVALSAVRQQLQKAGLDSVEVCCAEQNAVLPFEPVIAPNRKVWRPTTKSRNSGTAFGEAKQLSLFDL